MTKQEIKFKEAVDNGTLYWNDPNPIEGNDYRVTNIVYARPISIVHIMMEKVRLRYLITN